MLVNMLVKTNPHARTHPPHNSSTRTHSRTVLTLTRLTHTQTQTQAQTKDTSRVQPTKQPSHRPAPRDSELFAPRPWPPRCPPLLLGMEAEKEESNSSWLGFLRPRGASATPGSILGGG